MAEVVAMASKNGLDAATIDTLLALDKQFCFALHAAARLVVRAYQPLLRELDLTYSQYLVLLVLWEWQRTREAQPTLHALGARLDSDSGTLTPLLRRLEAKKLIVRERSRHDERELLLRVTAKGSALKQKACKVPLSLLQSSRLRLTEIVSMRDKLNRMRREMEQT